MMAVRFRTGAFALVVMLSACRWSMAQVQHFPIKRLPLVGGRTPADIAQLAEQTPCKRWVIGSIPVVGFLDTPSPTKWQTVGGRLHTYK